MDARSYVLYAVQKEWRSIHTDGDSERRLAAIACNPLSASSIAWSALSLRLGQPAPYAAILELQEQCGGGLFPFGEQWPVWIDDGELVNAVTTNALAEPTPELTPALARNFGWLDHQSHGELVCALAGTKVSRLTLTIGEARRLQHQLCIPLVCAPHIVNVQDDLAVAGFSHLAEKQDILRTCLSQLDVNAHIDVYVARDWRVAVLCWALDGTNSAGELLGTPSCCRDWFRRNWDECRKDYAGDLAFCCLKPLLNTDELEIPAITNPYAVYFGGSLLSHFPCSVSCEATGTIAEQRWRLLRALTPDLLEVIQRCHSQEFWVSRYRMVRVLAPANSTDEWCHVRPTQRGETMLP